MSKTVKLKNPKFCHFCWISESLLRLLEWNIFLLDILGFTKDHNWVKTKQYQTKLSLLRAYFRCFWPFFWPNLIFFPFSQVLTPHPNTTLVWGIQEHLSHQWKLFFCLVMLQDQCASWSINPAQLHSHPLLPTFPCHFQNKTCIHFLFSRLFLIKFYKTSIDEMK